MEDSTFDYFAMAEGVSHYNLLPDVAVTQWSAINQALNQAWRLGEPTLQSKAVSLSGCLEKLGSSLLQAHRLRNHHDILIRQITKFKDADGSLMAWRGAEACADFEGLLLQGRATLDRLTWFIATQFKNRSQSFKKIAAILSNFAANDGEARCLLSIIKAAHGWFDGTFGNLEGSKSLRDLVAHNHALTEGIRTCFGITRVSQNSALVIDCEVSLPNQSTPLAILATTHESVKYLSYLVLNSAATMMKVPQLHLEAYYPLWHNRTVALSKYVLTEPGDQLWDHTRSKRFVQ